MIAGSGRACSQDRRAFRGSQSRQSQAVRGHAVSGAGTPTRVCRFDAPAPLRHFPCPMLTTRALLLPSVPTMLIDEQRGDFTEMIEAVTAAGERLALEAPDALVALSARWASAGAFHADDARTHRSGIDLPGFRVEPRCD